MSVRETQILNHSDLKYLLIDSLKLYSDNVIFIGGNNPYRFSINGRTVYILIKNIHESGEGRSNQDECRIQISRTENFEEALNSNDDVVVLGYFADENVFTAWNPVLLRTRFNLRQTVSVYSRFSVQREASLEMIATYIDSNSQSVISFCPDYLGLYLENLLIIHNLPLQELRELARESDSSNTEDYAGELTLEKERYTITHTRYKRDTSFRNRVNKAYGHRCAICGIQLDLVEAAHIVPHSHERGTDEINNGITLCALHHKAYDSSLIYFDDDFNILINEKKMEYLEKVNKSFGLQKFQTLNLNKIILPENVLWRPNLENIRLANRIRGIEI